MTVPQDRKDKYKQVARTRRAQDPNYVALARFETVRQNRRGRKRTFTVFRYVPDDSLVCNCPTYWFKAECRHIRKVLETLAKGQTLETLEAEVLNVADLLKDCSRKAGMYFVASELAWRAYARQVIETGLLAKLTPAKKKGTKPERVMVFTEDED